MRLLTVPPGQHGANRRRKTSEMGRQLREKQKLKFMFGVNETQMVNYFTKAKRTKGNTGKFLCQLLEARLDNVLYRAGFAPTRAAARQLISHHHVLLNGKLNSIASHQVRINDTISLRKAETAKIPHIETSLARPDYVVPSWLKRENMTVQLIAIPEYETLEKQLNLRLIIEFYSK
jgi:small subunit ribosomal protein S4